VPVLVTVAVLLAVGGARHMVLVALASQQVTAQGWREIAYAQLRGWLPSDESDEDFNAAVVALR